MYMHSIWETSDPSGLVFFFCLRLYCSYTSDATHAIFLVADAILLGDPEVSEAGTCSTGTGGGGAGETICERERPFLGGVFAFVRGARPLDRSMHVFCSHHRFTRIQRGLGTAADKACTWTATVRNRH